MDVSEIRYAKSGESHIAYQVVGGGPRDLCIVPGIFTHLEAQWEQPLFARFLNRLASFCRLILFDSRGTGLSDRAPELPLIEQQMDDVTAVLTAVGSERTALLGVSQGGPMAALYAATYPQRVDALILYGTYAVVLRDDAYPWGRSRAWVEEYVRQLDENWGKGSFLAQLAPTMAADRAFRGWWGRFERLSSSPGNAIAYARMNIQIDVRHVLPAIRVPTLVIQREEDAYRDPGHARYIAEHIPAARLAEVPGVDHLMYVGDADAIIDEIQEFVTGVRRRPEPDRVLATVLFTDIVGSTERAAELGDRRWRELLGEYYAVVRRELDRFRGREIDTAGDGVLATFDGPARAVRCAMSIADAVETHGIRVRAGVHTGEVETAGGSLSGIAVHIGARIMAMASAGEVLVSSTVKELNAGSGIGFEDRGVHVLKGVPGAWHLFAAAAGHG